MDNIKSPSDISESIIQQCMVADRHTIKQLQRKADSHKNSQSDAPFEKLKKLVEKSQTTFLNREQNKPEFEYPDLPVADRRDDLVEAIKHHQVVIVAGETGSGKTTQLPKICLEAGRGISGLIGHTQPRRLAARSVATRIAEELKSELGQKVGFKIRFSDNTQPDSYIKLMTDGILLAEIQEDRFLNQYDTIIIDEAHERSLNIDFILGYLKQLLPKRKDLKVVITSATIDPERFSKHFNDAPIISVSGRTYPVEMRYRPLLDEDGEVTEQPQAILNAIDELSHESQGDILVFLSGEREIRDTAEVLNRAQLKHTEVVPLYARLSAVEQNRIFQAHSGRRVVLATNVAETSLTVPGIRYVIDPGFARVSRYSVRSKVQRLPIEAISQASANQRAGRCGRLSNGICIRLYSEEDFLSRSEFTDPEILRTNLASVILQMLSLGLGEIEQFPFVQKPDSRNISDGMKLLEELSAVIRRKGRLNLTNTGRKMSRLPVDPRYARMVLQAGENNSLQEVMIIVSGLSIQDPKERPRDKQQKADEAHQQWVDPDSDFVGFVNLWNEIKTQQKALTGNQFRKWCRQNFLNYLRVREWQDIFSQLRRSASELGLRINSQIADYDLVHQAIVPGLLSRIGQLDKDKEYLGARNNRFLVFPASTLAKKPPKWIASAELVETSRLFARVNARIQPQWLEQPAKHLSKYQYSEPYWSKKMGAVMASESVVLFGLRIVTNRRVTYTEKDPQLCRELFIREALVTGDTRLNNTFLKQNLSLISDVEQLEDKIRRKDILVDESVLESFYDERLPQHVCTEASFKKWWKRAGVDDSEWIFDPESLKKQDTTAINANNFPEQWQQDNVTLKLEYRFELGAPDDGVSLCIPLPLLNQVNDVGFDWLVPGFREELVVCLIKALPKQLRRNFVPAPDYARAVVAEISPQDGGFIEALSGKLFKMTGVKIEEDSWQMDTLPEHLKFNFKVIAADGQTLKQGRDLYVLQKGLKSQVKKTIKQGETPAWLKENVTEWDFDSLPEYWESKSGGYTIKSYPALKYESGKISVKLLPNEEEAAIAHRNGVCQLLMKQLPSPIKYLQDKLPNKSKLGLFFNPFGQIKKLIDDFIEAVIKQELKELGVAPKDAESFNALAKMIAGDLNERVLEVAKQVETGLTQAHAIHKKLKGNVPLNMITAHGSVLEHLNSLVYPGFVTDIGVSRLKDWNRYLAALGRRFEKLPIDPTKDRTHQLVIDKISQKFEAQKNKFQRNQQLPYELMEVRWMIEELRVSLFAQQLGTSMPISSKRIENYLDKF